MVAKSPPGGVPTKYYAEIYARNPIIIIIIIIIISQISPNFFVKKTAEFVENYYT